MLQYLDRIQKITSAYASLVNEFKSIFDKLSHVEADTEALRQNPDYFVALDKKSIPQLQALLEQLNEVDGSNLNILKQARVEIENVIPRIYNQEPVDAASQDVEKLNSALKYVLQNWTDLEKELKSKLKERLDDFKSDQEKCHRNSIQVSIFRV